MERGEMVGGCLIRPEMYAENVSGLIWPDTASGLATILPSEATND